MGNATGSMLADLCAALGWQGGTIHDALREVQRLRADAARLETKLSEAHQTIGAQKMTSRLLEARAERAEARAAALCDVVSTELGKLENIRDFNDGVAVAELVDEVCGGLGDGLYPASAAKSKPAVSNCPMAIRCPDGLPVCATCKATEAA